jgi:hypothetical protein
VKKKMKKSMKSRARKKGKASAARGPALPTPKGGFALAMGEKQMQQAMKKKKMPMVDETEMLMQQARGKHPKKKKRALAKLYRTPTG